MPHYRIKPRFTDCEADASTMTSPGRNFSVIRFDSLQISVQFNSKIFLQIIASTSKLLLEAFDAIKNIPLQRYLHVIFCILFIGFVFMLDFLCGKTNLQRPAYSARLLRDEFRTEANNVFDCWQFIDCLR